MAVARGKGSKPRHPIVQANEAAYGVYRKKATRAKLTDADFAQLEEAKKHADVVWKTEIKQLKEKLVTKSLDKDHKEWVKLYGKTAADAMRNSAKAALEK
jgi:hypothetical protein